MDEVYQIASTESVQLLERELAVQLAELKAEIEEQGPLQGTAPGVSSSVRVPKDVSYFRRERELALKKILQVAEAKPLVVQADVMQRELESCLRREYTPENLPLLLLQHYTERMAQLAQSKYLHMLRWKRFCQHSKIMEQLHPLYQKQVGYIMREYNDTIHRAERLSVARENFLMGKSNPSNLVTQEDLTIYTRWFVCHLHSLKTIHHYLQLCPSSTNIHSYPRNLAIVLGVILPRLQPFMAKVPLVAPESHGVVMTYLSVCELFEALQYLPISKVLSVTADRLPEVGPDNEKDIGPDIQSSASPGPTGTDTSGTTRSRATFLLPQHTAELGDVKPQLKRLLFHYSIPFDVEELRDSAKEMELLSLVSQKFQSVFKEQQRMQTFPDYHAGIANTESPGLAGRGVAFKKRADWIAFIKIKPKCDPWQKKFLTKLKERRRTDGLMQLQAKFLKISSPGRAVQALQDHAAKMITLAAQGPSFAASQGLHQCNYDHIWERIYSNVHLYQVQQREMAETTFRSSGKLY
ncbi:putative uncharacterized protein C6orf183 [Echinops telfairi]|uniref:Uncharacterized protein n=1 Tax=Echinops telfairi TaxID=9371 RepID=A0AC55DFM1_ECHTE|nr:putative uncharacterized protein C6orf183 [Echinops telfairi]